MEDQPKEINAAEKRTAFVAGLRAAADWYEQHPAVKPPHQYPYMISNFAVDGLADMKAVAEALGTCDKETTDSFYRLKRNIGNVILEFVSHRATVCERVVVGTKMVSRQVPVYAAPEPVEYRTEEVEEEIVEWRCPPLLEHAEADNVPRS